VSPGTAALALGLVLASGLLLSLAVLGVALLALGAAADDALEAVGRLVFGK